MQKHRMIFASVVAMAALASRQATPCQLQQAGPTDEALDKAQQNLTDMSGLVDDLVAHIVASDAVQADLRAQIASLLSGDAATAAKADALFQKSEEVEAKMRASLPGVPPPGGTALNQSYPGPNGDADFTAAAAAYNGPEVVKLNGIELPTAFTGTTAGELLYYSHSTDGSVSTTGPSD